MSFVPQGRKLRRDRPGSPITSFAPSAVCCRTGPGLWLPTRPFGTFRPDVTPRADMSAVSSRQAPHSHQPTPPPPSPAEKVLLNLVWYGPAFEQITSGGFAPPLLSTVGKVVVRSPLFLSSPLRSLIVGPA